MTDMKVIKKAKGDVEQLMLEAEDNENKAKQLKTKADIARKKIKADLIGNGIDAYIVDNDETNPKFLQASVYTMRKINYDVEAIRERLSKEQRKLVTETIMIAEQTGLKEFVKRHPELREEIKGFVSKIDMVDEHKLGLAIEHGNVTLKDIEGCYSVNESDVFKMQRIKRFELLE